MFHGHWNLPIALAEIQLGKVTGFGQTGIYIVNGIS